MDFSILQADGDSGVGCPVWSQPWLMRHDACTWGADIAVYKRLQERAYTNFAGASALSVVSLMCLYPLILVLEQLASVVAERHFRSSCLKSMLQFLAAVLPFTGTYSAPHHLWKSGALFLCLCAGLAALADDPLVWPRYLSRMWATRAVRKADLGGLIKFTYIDEAKQRLRFVAEYRAVVMITTCIVILAVDFPSIFVRSHAKTEEYGFSLMDLGTGTIVVSSAVCSRAARGLRSGRNALAVWRRIVALWPVVLLGVIRFLLLSGIDYHVPTSEYGVHWNFFFTITVVACISTAADLSAAASAVAGVVVLVSYEIYLNVFGGAEFILHAPRLDFFSANREGILSCAGFLGIHWLSVAIGSCIRTSIVATRTANQLLAIAAGSLVLVVVFDAAGVQVSRRMCNLPYAVFVLGVNALVMSLLALIDLWWPVSRRELNPVFKSVQDAMLITFLVANVCTGIVNMCIQPLVVPARPAMLIMVSYSLVFIKLVVWLHSRGLARFRW